MTRNTVLNRERVVSIVGAIFALAAFFASYYSTSRPNSVMRFFGGTRLVLMIVHSASFITAILNTFLNKRKITILIMLWESAAELMSENEYLGLFFFYAALILILIEYVFMKPRKGHIVTLILLHLITLGLSGFSGVTHFFTAFSGSVFFGAFYFWIYKEIKDKVSCLIPHDVSNNPVMGDKKAGSKISLSDYNLSDRQKALIMDYLNYNLSYKDLANKYFVSLSTVKKEFTDIFQIFAVKKLEDFHILMIQYQVEE